MKLTEEHAQFRSALADWIERELNPYVDQWEQDESFPAHEVFKKLGSLGYLGVQKPVEFGGMGLDHAYATVMAETLGRVRSSGVAMAIGVQTDMCTPALAKYGSDELKREYLRPSIEGDLVGCIGVSEPEAGSDVAAIRTTARRDGSDYILDGGKMWITNGLQADWMCCLANTEPNAPPHRNKSLIVVPLSAPGVERARKLSKLGMRASDTAQIFFDGVRVPERNRIGPAGMGFAMQMSQFQEERIWGAANALGSMELTLRDTVEYTSHRKAFGRSILDNQIVHFRLAELSTEIECLRALIYDAVEHYIAGEDVTRLATMAKLKAGRLAREVADTCLQFWGGMGYMWESPVARFYRDARLLSIGAGADEVMLSVLCKLAGTLPGSKGKS